MAKGAQFFPHRQQRVEGGAKAAHIGIHCSRCHEELWLRTNVHQPAPVEFNARFFRLQGWIIGSRRNKDLCPACAGRGGSNTKDQEDGMKPQVKSIPKIDMRVRMNSTPGSTLVEVEDTLLGHGRPFDPLMGYTLVEEAPGRVLLKADGSSCRRFGHTTYEIRGKRFARIGFPFTLSREFGMSDLTGTWDEVAQELRVELPANLAAPRRVVRRTKAERQAQAALVEATPEHRRAVIEQLVQCYDIPAARYRAGSCDAKVAEHLGVDEALVARLREEFFGPAGVDPREGLVEAFQSRLDGLERRLETALEEADAARRELAALRAEIRAELAGAAKGA